jgi:autotransporter translocation and assembly factor TamB
MAIGGRQTTQVEVQGDIADLAALFTTLKLTNMVPPEAGRVVLKTTAAFDLADLREKNLNRATAEGSLGVTSLQWREGRLDAFASTFSLREGLATVRAELNHQGKNTADLNATLRLSDRQPAKVDWVIKLTDLASLVPMAGLKDTPPPVAGTVNSAGSATFDLADVKEKRLERIAATGNLAVRALKWREGILDQMNADFAMRDGAVSLEANLNHANANTASIAGQMQLTGRQATSVKWQANLTALSTLIPLTGLTPPPSAGVVTSQGTAAFDAVDLKEKQYNKVAAQGELLVNALQWRGGTLAKVNAVFNVREGIADLNPGIIQFDEQNQITVRGRMPLDTRQPFQAEVHGRMPRLTSLSPWLAMAKTPPLTSGSAAIDWSGTGVIATGNITGGGTVKVDDLKIKGRAEQYSLALTTKHEGKRAEISELRASAGAFRLEATAAVSETELSVPRLTFYSDKVKLVDGMVQVPLALNQQPRPAVPVDATKPMKVQLKMEKLNFTQVFAAIGKKAPVDGVVSADVDIQGTLPDLRGKVSAVMNGVRADALKGKLEPADVKLNLTLEHDRLAVDTTVTQKPLQPLKVTGGMRLNVETVMKNPKALMDEPVEAEIVLPPSSLASVPRFVPALSKLEGTVAINVKINGSAQKPSWAGTVRTDVTSIALTDVPMDVKDVKAHLDFKDTRIDLSNVSATVAGGKVRIDGGVDAANVKDPVMNLHLVADQALLVRDNTMSFRANADIICKGTLAKSAVNGRVELVRGRVFKEVEFLPLSLPNQLPPPPPAVRAGKAGPPAAPGMLKDWTFDVAVTTRDPIRLLGNVLNGSVLVNVSARGNGAAPAIEGKATLDGAKLSLPFSRLTITRGEIIMTKDNPFDPTIDIQGDSLINNYQVTVYAYGRARDPKLRFTSSPPLPENEIASLLATGSTSGDAGGAEGMAANRAAFLLVSQTYRKLFNKAAPKRRLDEEPSKLTFSVDPLGSSGRGGGGGSGPGVTARYDINPNLQATGSVGGDGFRGLIYYLVRLR